MTADTRDEVAAERFRRRRLRSALLQGDPDSPKTPLARLGAGVYGGLAVTVLLLAVAGIYGVLRPGGSTAWQEPGAFVVDDDSGARYVYLDGVLHPVLNYASARLLLGDGLHVVTVSTASLDSGGPRADDRHPGGTRLAARRRAHHRRGLVGLRGWPGGRRPAPAHRDPARDGCGRQRGARGSRDTWSGPRPAAPS